LPAQWRGVPLASSSDSRLETPNRVGIVSGWGTLRPLRVDVLTNQPVLPGALGYFTNRLMEVQIPLADRETC
jgi:hypothetical protein